MAKLNIEMTYPVPDKYLSQSTAAGNTASMSYLGPDTIWVQVYKDGENKGKWNKNPIKTNYADDGDFENGVEEEMADAIRALPVPLDAERIEIDCTTNPHLCAIWTKPETVGDDTPNYTSLPQQQDSLADGKVYYSRPQNDKIPPDHVWNPMESSWNFDTEEWDLVLRKPEDFGMPTSWDEIRAGRNAELELTDIKGMLPEGDEKAAWDTYRQALRDLPATYEGIEPHTVPRPNSPEEIKNNAERPATNSTLNIGETE